MRVLCLVGILDFPQRKRMWALMEEAFRETFPDMTYVVVHRFFWPWQVGRVRDYAADVLSTYDDGTPTLLLGYSLGGIIAQAIAEKFKHTPLLGIVSVCSPLRFASWWGLTWNPMYLQHNRFAFAGLFDLLINPLFVYGAGVPVHLMKTDHLASFVFFRGASQKVATTLQLRLALQPHPTHQTA